MNDDARERERERIYMETEKMDDKVVDFVLLVISPLNLPNLKLNRISDFFLIFKFLVLMFE